MLRIAVPDLVSNSYFPIIAAVEMGFFKEEGFDASVDLLFPIPKTFQALRDGALDFVVGSAHATLLAFPNWQGAKLLAACAQHTYWFLVVRSDLHPRRGDLSIVKGLRLGAAPGVDLSLRRMLISAGIDPEKNQVQIMPIPVPTFPSGFRPPKPSKMASSTVFGPMAWVVMSLCAAAWALWCSTCAAVMDRPKRVIILFPLWSRPINGSRKNPNRRLQRFAHL